MSRSLHAFRILRRCLILSTLAAACLSLPFVVGQTGAHAGQATALDLAGSPVDPLKSAPGKVVVLVFVRTDCPVSNRYSPAIQHLSAQYLDKTAFWLVYPANNESAEMIRKHEQEFGYQLPALRDLQHALVKQSHVQITPEAAVFDARHHLIYHGRIDNLYEDFGRARAAPTTHELEDAIQAAISGKTLLADTVPAVGCYISDLE
jgi:hypothetical protein